MPGAILLYIYSKGVSEAAQAQLTHPEAVPGAR